MLFHPRRSRYLALDFSSTRTIAIVTTTFDDAGPDMNKALAAMMLLVLAPVAQARSIDWQAELDRCRAMREQMQPLLLAGQGLSPIARSGTAARRCVWIVRRALKRGAR
jgi:hypothetical protein